MNRTRLIILSGVLMVAGLEVLHFVRGKMIAEEQTLRSAAMQLLAYGTFVQSMRLVRVWVDSLCPLTADDQHKCGLQIPW